MSSIIFPFSAIGIVGAAAGLARDAEGDQFFPDRDMREPQYPGGFVQAFGLLIGSDNARYMRSNSLITAVVL